MSSPQIIPGSIHDGQSTECSFVTESDVSVFDMPMVACQEGIDYQQAEQHKDAIKSFSNALERYRLILVEDDNEDVQKVARIGVARVLNCLGISYRAEGEESKARGCFRNALAEYDGVDKTVEDEDVAERQYHLGLDYEATNNLEAAQSHYTQALVLFRDIDTRTPCKPQIAMTLQRLGLVYEAQSKLSDARTCFSQALGLYRDNIFPEQLNHPHLRDAKNSYERINRTLEEAKSLAQSQSVTVAVPVQNPTAVASRPASPSCCGFFGAGKAQQIESPVANPMSANGTYQPPIMR